MIGFSGLARKAARSIAILGAFTATAVSAQVLLYPPNYPTGPMEPSDPAVGVAAGTLDQFHLFQPVNNAGHRRGILKGNVG